ncbi:MAG: NAD(P)-dependent oxidoreductase [Weeksellaceae bacterium]
MQKIAITGASGLIGSRVIELLQDTVSFIPLRQTDMDVTDEQSVDKALSGLDYDILLHCAGYTNVEGAETERDQAYNLNVTGTKNILATIEKSKKKMMYISTDFVFDGTNPPYDETSTPNPLGYYAQTKYEGEKLLTDKAMIVRISYPYGYSPAPKADFAHKIAALIQDEKPLHMIQDAMITPTYIDDIVYGLQHLFNHFSPSIYHLVGSESISPYDSGRIIAREFGLSEKLVKPTTFKEFTQGKAPRPQYSEIVSKTNDFYPMKSFSEGIIQLFS